MRYIIITISILSVLSCSKQSSRLEQVMILAGENRKELEKVITFYNKEAKDTLKLKAAYFLIENMPSHYSLVSDKFDKIKNEIYPFAIENDCSPLQAYDSLVRKYGKLSQNDFRKEYDVQHITSEYLIDNIEWSFNVWEQSNWGKNIIFEQFCEEILPYRIGNERIDLWRGDYFDVFSSILADSLKQASMLTCCQIIYNELSKEEWMFENEISFPSKGASTLLKSRYGNCNDRCELVVYAMRSVGIPCGIDLLLQAPEKRTPFHYWNYITDEKGNTIDFAIEDMFPDSTKQKAHFKIGKAYRMCFAAQPPSTYQFDTRLINNLSMKSGNILIKDVSINYFPNEKVKIPILGKYTKDIVALNVFNNETWVPIGYADIVESDSAQLNYLEPDILYMLGTYKNNIFYPRSLPFVYKGVGKYDLIEANTTQFESINIDRKYPTSDRLAYFQKRLIGGEFQGANRKDFKDAKLLYRIDSLPSYKYQDILLHIKDKFKYLRYVSGINGHCEIGDIAFFSTESENPLKGNIIGEGISYGNDPKVKREHVFDGDPLTYFSANSSDGAWVGIELDHPQEINRIQYIGRNDDNGIRKGDHYQLFYYSGQNWISLGKRIGKNDYLEFDNVPKGALLWLRNTTRGKEERPFTYENGKQVWW